MSQAHALQYVLTCGNSECGKSFSTDSVAEAFNYILEHSRHTSHDVHWGSERFDIPRLSIGDYIVECPECSNRVFEDREEAIDYYEGHQEHTGHDISDPKFRETELSEVPIPKIVDELTNRRGFEEGVPLAVILSLAEGPERSARVAYLEFKEMREEGHIYAPREDRYVLTPTIRNTTY